MKPEIIYTPTQIRFLKSSAASGRYKYSHCSKDVY